MLYGLIFADLRGDIGGKLDDLDHLAMAAPHSVVGCLQPDFMAFFIKSLKAPRFERPLSQLLPEIGMFPIKQLITKHAMLMAFNFIESIAHGIQEITVGGNNNTSRFKLDDGEGAIQRLKYCFLSHEQIMLHRHI